MMGKDLPMMCADKIEDRMVSGLLVSHAGLTSKGKEKRHEVSSRMDKIAGYRG